MSADKKAMNRALAVAALALLPGLGDLRAAGVCSNTPGAGDWIDCDEASTSTSDIDIDATSIDIDTTGSVDGVSALHLGNGNIDISITGTTTTPSTIDTTGASAAGIEYRHGQSASGTTTLTLENTEITTQGANAYGIDGRNQGSSGVIKADLRTGVVIDTSGSRAHGVTLEQSSGSDDGIILADGIEVTTRGSSAQGLQVRQSGRGEARIEVSDSTIAIHGNGGYGIYGYRPDSSGDIDIDVVGGSTTTGGYTSHGIVANHDRIGRDNTGNVEITTRNHAIETTGTADHPNQALDGTFSYGIYAIHENSGNIDIDVEEGSSVTTHGKNSHGIVTYHYGTEATRSIDITLDGSVTVHGEAAQGVRVGILTSGAPARIAGLDSEGYRRHTVTVNGPIRSMAEGVFLANGGRVIIGPQGSIDSDSRIVIRATGTVPQDNTDPNNVIAAIPPKLRVDLNLDGRGVAQAIGGGWIINDGGETTIAVNGTVLHDGKTGVTGATAPNGTRDVTMLAGGRTVVLDADLMILSVSERDPSTIQDRDFSNTDFDDGEPPPPPPPPTPTPRPPPEPAPQEHRVNEAISAGTGAPAGVVVRGDGEVYIGAQGSIEAASGIAILATGDAPELLVDITLDGRQVVEVIGDDWIINDGGGTTIVVNGVKLHDATAGTVAGASAPNGARNVRVEADSVRIREEGVRITDRSDPDPANWVISDPAEGVIADRDFSVADFIETRAAPDPDPDPTPPMFIEEYAPRAALYEALPDVLLRLHERTPTAPRTAPAWFTVTGRKGSQDFERSTVGIEYDTDYLEVEAGKHVPLTGNFDAWAALHYLTGTAEVSSPVRGGDIDVQGLGLSLELCCGTGDGYASARAALTRYDLDLSSDERGRLKSGVNAYAHALQLEAGRRLQRGNIQLSPRIRLDHARVSVERFTDAVDARVSYPDEDRFAVALGVMAETGHDATEDGLSLWGSLDIEHRLGDVQTVARVSGERLKARPETDSLLLGAGGTWQRGSLKIGAGLSAREELGSGGEQYGATLNLGMQF